MMAVLIAVVVGMVVEFSLSSPEGALFLVAKPARGINCLQFRLKISCYRPHCNAMEKL